MRLCIGHPRGRIIGTSVRLDNERLSQMNYGTISAQPIEIHMTHFFGVIIHQPDCGSTPIDCGLPTVLVSDSECLLGAKPSFVGREELKISLDVVQHGVLGILDVCLDVIDVPL